MASSKEKIKNIILIIFVLLFFCKCNYKGEKARDFNIYIDSITFISKSIQTEFFPKVLFRIKIVNNCSDTLLFIKGVKDHFSYSNNFFKVDSVADNNSKLKVRLKHFLPFKDDPNFYTLSPGNLLDNKIIIHPNKTEYITVYRAYNAFFSSSIDSIEFYNYVLSLKIRYNNSLNYDSLKKTFPNYQIIKKYVINSSKKSSL